MQQGLVLGPVFLIYNDHLTQRLNSEVKLFAGDTSLFSIANCVNISALPLNTRLLKKTEYTSGKCHSIQIELSKYRLFSS